MTFFEIVKLELPFLDPAQDENLVSNFKEVLFFEYFVAQGNRDEADLASDTFTHLERFFLANFTALRIVKRASVKNVEGENGIKPEAPRFLRKAKADVVEAEFETLAGKVAAWEADLHQVCADLESRICLQAQQLGYSVDFCKCETHPQPFLSVFG